MLAVELAASEKVSPLLQTYFFSDISRQENDIITLIFHVQLYSDDVYGAIVMMAVFNMVQC